MFTQSFGMRNRDANSFWWQIGSWTNFLVHFLSFLSKDRRYSLFHGIEKENVDTVIISYSKCKVIAYMNIYFDRLFLILINNPCQKTYIYTKRKLKNCSRYSRLQKNLRFVQWHKVIQKKSCL